MRKIEILVPVGEVKLGKMIKVASRPSNLEGKVVGLLWNHKPNGNLLLENLEKLVKKKYKLCGTLMREKPLSSSEAPHEVLEELFAKCDLVILAIGD